MVNCHSRLSQRLAQVLVGPCLIGPSSRVLKRRAGETQRGGWGGLSVVQGVLGSWGWHGPETGGGAWRKKRCWRLRRRPVLHTFSFFREESGRQFSIPHGTAQARSSVGPLAGPDMTCTIWAEEATRLAAGEAAGGLLVCWSLVTWHCRVSG
jgi:hypothetical protein